MFEHLDDPEELRIDHRHLAGVVRRAETIRTRKRWMAAGAAVVLCAVLLVAAVGFTLSRPLGQPSSIASNYQFNLAKGPLPLGAPVPTTALLDVQFADPHTGFALALHRNEVILAASSDGGATWRVRNNRLPAGLGPGAGYPGQFEFVGFTGYLWGARTGGGAPLWMSHDDGTSWHEAPIGPDVYDVSAIGLDVWALAGTCSTTSAPASPCALSVERSSDGGATWSSAGPLELAAGGAVDGRSVELARITRSRSYVLTSTRTTNGDTAWQLAFTGDSGATWSSRPVPCHGAFSLGAEVAASSTEDLWLLCGSQATGGAQSKQLYRSEDAGQTWRLAASATGLGTPPPPSVPPDPLPLSGYIAPFTVGHHNLAVASPTTAWLFPARGDLSKTKDGGSSWVPVPDLASAGFASGGQGDITFLSATEGWICEYGVGLWHTGDGVTWHPLGTG